MSSPSNNRRIHSLPSTADGPSTSSTLAPQSDRRSSTLYNSSLLGGNLSLPSTSSGTRAVSNPTSPRPRRAPAAAGGFLLDNASTRSSIDFSRGSLEHAHTSDYASSSILHPQPSLRNARREKQKERDDDTDTDPARMVSMVLSEASRRKRESKRASRAVSSQHESTSFGGTTSLHPPPSPVRSRRESAAGLRRAASPTRSFLMESTGRFRTASPPAAPVRPNFPPTSLPPISFTEEREWYKRRRSVGQEKLREVQRQKGFTEATLQRTLKAKQTLELGALYKELLEVDGTRTDGTGNHRYNPLQAIRNRKLRNRKKIQLDISPWKDPSVVEQWVERICTSPRGANDGGLPPPPLGEGKVMKRPKMDWMVSPEEMLADYYWLRTEESKHEEMEKELNRRKRRNMKDRDSKENKRESWDVPSGGSWHEADNTKREGSVISTGKSHAAAQYHKFKQDPDYEDTSSLSESSSGSDDGNIIYPGTDSEPQSEGQEEDLRKHHRRRRKLGRMIKGRHHKSKKSKQDLSEENRRKHDGEMEWVQSEEEERKPIPIPLDQPEYRASMDFDEVFTLAPTGQSHSPPKLFQNMAADNLPNLGSRSSLDRYPPSGLGINSVADNVVPSIAISLSPPRAPARPKDDPDEKDKTVSPTKRLLERTKDSLAITTKERDLGDVDSGRESLDISDIDGGRKRSKPSVPSKLKTRVDKLRDDFTPWPKHAPAPSPTASSFSGSDDDSPASDIAPRKPNRQSLEVPRSDPRAPKHRSTFSTPQLPSFALGRTSCDSSREPSPERPTPSKRRHLLHRDRSPARDLKIAPLEPANAFAPPPEPAPLPPLPVVVPHYRRDPSASRLAALAAGILARHHARLPPPPTPSCRALDAPLAALAAHRHTLLTTRIPALHARIATLTDGITALSPALHGIADEAETLEGTVTMSYTREVTAAKEDLVRLARSQRRGRGRWVMLAGWALLEWSLVGVMRGVRVVVWCVWIVRWVLGWGWWVVRKGVRWVLWI
ncbi:hypothetical protein EDC01DRAFT_786464 [Geopyxis carbonaria]|nr:hypothetical protein EDC01DRAFT_786464 [Geopyxis carbonaria]